MGESLLVSSCPRVRPPIVILLKGRLGNQLFQYATAVALTRDTGRDVLFHTYEVTEADLLLPFLVGPDFRRATARELFAAGGWVPWHTSSLGERVFYRLIYRGRIRSKRHRSLSRNVESALAYDPSFQMLRATRSIEGYFQNARYWDAVIDDVSRVVGDNLAAATTHGGRPEAESVGVHVRGLDYLDHGWGLPLEYYRLALGSVVSATGVSRAEVYGDDGDAISAVRKECRQLGLDVAPSAFGPDPSWRGVLEDLRRLSACAYLVCSNSTFAWWGACLGDRQALKKRVVVVPEPWLQGQMTNLARPAWTRFPVPGW